MIEIRENIKDLSLIDIKLIDDDPIWNCRGKIGLADIDDLLDDIPKRGLMQPIVVRPMVNGDKQYRVIAGFRRLKALRTMDWEKAPCIVRECTDQDAVWMNFAENLKRKDLDFIQEGEGLYRVLNNFPMPIPELAERVGQSQRWVRLRLFAVNMPEEVKVYIRSGALSMEQVEFIFNKPTEAEQLKCVRQIKEAKERGMRILLGKPKRTLPVHVKVPQTREKMFLMIKHIIDALGTGNFGTRCLAWAANEIDDQELLGDLKHLCELDDIPYEPISKIQKKGIIEQFRRENPDEFIPKRKPIDFATVEIPMLKKEVLDATS